MAAQPGLCRTWLETPKTGFLTTKLIWQNGFSHDQVPYCFTEDDCSTCFNCLGEASQRTQEFHSDSYWMSKCLSRYAGIEGRIKQ